MTEAALIHCVACDAEIARNAPTCPKCGGLNEWVHPRLVSFAEKAGNIDLGGRRFFFHVYRDRLIGSAVPRWRLLQHFAWAVGVFLASIVFSGAAGAAGSGIVILFWFTRGVAELYIVILVAAMMLWGFLRVLDLNGRFFFEEVPLWHEGFGGRSRFEFDLSGEQPVWKSDNDLLWEPVRRALLANG